MGSPPCAIFRYPDDLTNIVQQCARGEKDGAMAPDEALGPRRLDGTGRAGQYTGQVVPGPS